MLDTKLVQVLRCLEAKEVKKLYEFLDSPFFVKREKGVQLLRYLKGYFPLFDSPNLSKESLYEHLFNKNEYNNLNFNRLLVYAMDIVEDFLRYYYFNPSDVHLNKPLFDFYIKHNLPKHFETLHKSLENIYEKAPQRNVGYLFQKWLLAAAATSQNHTNYIREDANPLSEMIKNLDSFYIAKKLTCMCANIAYKNVLHKTDTNFIEEEIIVYLRNLPIQNTSPTIQVFYHIYLMLKDEEAETNFEAAYQINVMYCMMFDNSERLDIYTSLQNFCIRQINLKGDIYYEKKLFDLYKEQLNASLFYDGKGSIPPSNFKNIVQLSLRLKEYNWAAHFIETYSEKLSPDKRSDVENQARASYSFAIGKYSDTLKILQDTEPVDIFFKIDAKRLIIRTYYELQEEELALSSLNTFRVFVHRDNIISENHKLTNRNFTNILAKLIQTDKTDKLIKLQEELKEMPSIADRKWLAEKIAERIAAR